MAHTQNLVPTTAATQPLTLLSLPTEIHREIVNNLHYIDDFLSKSNLRATCRHFHSLIEPYTHAELLEIEISPFCMERELYTCGDCIRLLPKSKFADKMRKGKKGKGCSCPEKRFCIKCGLSPWSVTGVPKYTRGAAIIEIMGERHVVCIECGILGLAASDRTERYCQACWTQPQGSGYSRQYLARRKEELARERELREKQARWRAARAARHKRMSDIWGSDYESSSNDDDFDSEQEWMDQLGREAYPNSPRPGSD